MKIDILTIFPEMFEGAFGDSILKRAQDENHVEINLHNLRDWTTDVHRSVDDRPFGGGAGMVMRVDVIDRAVNSIIEGGGNLNEGENYLYEGAKTFSRLHTKIILLDTKGPFYTQSNAQQLSHEEHLILIVPHYEGVDHRVHEYIADEVYSIGPYVLTGGELPAMVLVDSVVRLLPGVISPDSLREESYNQLSMQDDQLIVNVEYPQYTRPSEYNEWKVPDVLLSGHHKEINKWRKSESEKLSEKVKS